MTTNEPLAKMNPEVKAKWVAALRSGKYKQGKGRLQSLCHWKHCCLGVLANEMGWLNDNGSCTPLDGSYMNDAVIPPDRSLSIGLDIEAQDVLTSMNDSMWQQRDFYQIADWIEANL